MQASALSPSQKQNAGIQPECWEPPLPPQPINTFDYLLPKMPGMLRWLVIECSNEARHDRYEERVQVPAYRLFIESLQPVDPRQDLPQVRFLALEGHG